MRMLEDDENYFIEDDGTRTLLSLPPLLPSTGRKKVAVRKSWIQEAREAGEFDSSSERLDDSEDPKHTTGDEGEEQPLYLHRAFFNQYKLDKREAHAEILQSAPEDSELRQQSKNSK